MSSFLPVADNSLTVPDRRTRHKIEIRNRLCKAALELFARKGFAETTVEEITNAADVGKGTFFNYFPSKDHIFLAFGELQVSRIAEHVEESRHSQEPVIDILRRLKSKMTAEPAKSPAIIRMLLQANLSSQEVQAGMLENHKRANALLAELFHRGQERGEIRQDLAALELAMIFRQSMFGNVLLWSLAPDASLQSRMDAVFEILWSGLQPRNSEGRKNVTEAAEESKS